MGYLTLPRYLAMSVRVAARSALAAALAVSLTALGPVTSVPVAVAAVSDVWLVDTVSRTEADLRATYESHKPTASGPPYAATPSVQAPYSAGVLSSAFLSDGLRTLNFARYLAGLPHDVVLDPAAVSRAQHGAVLLAAGSFSHAPPKPADMPHAFYEIGYASTTTSNIGRGSKSLAGFQLGCLADSGTSNLPHVGHRRWLLNPAMQKTGMGFIDGYATTWALDRSRSEDVEYDALTWPAAGVFPVEYFKSDTPWSITLNPDRFDWDSSGHVVTMRRVSDGRTWTFTASNSDAAGDFFGFDETRMGVGNVFVFRPDPATVSYQAGDEFEVRLSGGVYHNGTRSPVTVRYWTQFVTVEPSAPPTPPGYYERAFTRSSERLADDCRFSTAVAISREGNPDWLGVENVIVASGDNRAASDALAASGLAWAYDAPVLLVSASRTPEEVKIAIKSIVDANGSVALRVVGGPLAVPEERLTEIAQYAGADKVTIDRIVSTGNRYDLAAAIAARMREVRGADMPSAVLIANGADPSRFADALALSPISASIGAPILLVAGNSVPVATREALNALNPSTRILGGGPLAVSETVRSELRATRWAGSTRYETAIEIANEAVTRGWLDPSSGVGLAAKMPDALTGGSFIGRRDGVLLLTGSGRLSDPVRDWLGANKARVESAYLFGGTTSISDTVRVQVGASLQ